MARSTGTSACVDGDERRHDVFAGKIAEASGWPEHLDAELAVGAQRAECHSRSRHYATATFPASVQPTSALA